MTAHAPRIDAAELDAWWSGLVSLYREEADHASDPAIAARHLDEAARICVEELDDPDRARSLYREAHDLAPSDPLAARALADLAERAADWPDVVRWLDAALDATAEGPARVGLLARLAAVQHTRLGDRPAAARRLREALDRAPEDRALLARLALLLPDDDPEAHLDHLRRRLVQTRDPARRAELFYRIGRIRERAQGDEHRAIEAYRLAFESDPDHLGAIDARVSVLLRAERWEELVEALDAAVAQITDDAARGRLHLLAALVLGARLDAPERARPHLGAALGAVGDDPVAALEIASQYERLGLWRNANDILAARASDDAALWYRVGLNHEAGLGDSPAALAAHRRAVGAPEVAVPALAAVRRVAARDDDLAPWRAAIEGLIERCAEPAVRAALSTHLADVLRLRADDEEGARRHYGRAVADAFAAAGDAPATLPPAFEERLDLLRAQDNWAVVEEELTRALARPLEPRSRARASAALAELLDGRLARPDDAFAHYRAALAADPTDRYAREAIQRLLAARAEHGALAEALADELREVEPDRGVRVLTRLAELRGAMGDPEGVEAAWRGALDLDPGWLPALRGLGRLLHQHGRWRDLAALHAHELATLAPDDTRRVALLGKLAELYEFNLDQPDDAIERYEAILDLRPGAPDAVAGLERLYRQAERWPALDRVLAGRAAALDDPTARAVVLLQLADVRLDRRDDLPGALAAYEEALDLVPDLWPAAWAIERLALRHHDDARLVELYREILPRLPTPGQTAITRHKLAAVLPQHEAVPLLEDAVIEGADPESAWALVREAAEHGDRAQLSARLAGFAQLVDARRDAHALWLEAACHGEAAELPASDLVALWNQVLHLEPTADRAWTAILRLRRSQRQAGEVAALLLRRADETADPREASIALWTAGVIEERRGMPSVGLDAFIEASAACPDDPTPRWLVLDRALDGDETLSPAEHAGQLVDLARRQADGPGAAAHLIEAGRLRADVLDDADGALDAFLEAVRRDPSAEEAAERAAAMLDARDLSNELAALLRHRIDRLDGPAARLPLLRRLAEVQLEDLGRRAEAAETLEQFIALAPADLDARVRLADLRYSLEAWPEAAEHYRLAAQAAHDDALLGRLYTRLGLIRARHLGDLPGAIEDLRRAVGLGTDDRALGELAQVYLMAGESDLALMAFQRLEKLADEPGARSAARAGQVHALLRRGRRAEAIERLEAFREIDPIDPMLATLARDLDLEPARRPIELPPALLERSPGPTDPPGAPLGSTSGSHGSAGSTAGSDRFDRLDLSDLSDDDHSADADPEPDDGAPRAADQTTRPPAAAAEPAAAPLAAIALRKRAADPGGPPPDAYADIDAELDRLDAHVPDPRTVEPLPAIPSPLDSSIDEALDALAIDGALAALPGPFDAMADTGSIADLDDAGSLDLDALDLDALDAPDPLDALDDVTAPEAGPRRSLVDPIITGPAVREPSTPRISARSGLGDPSLTGLLRPDIEQTTGSLPTLRIDRRSEAPGAASVEHDSIDIDASTDGWRRDALLALEDSGSSPDTAAARERLREHPLDARAWRTLRTATTEPVTARWYDDVIAWIEGDIAPGRPARSTRRLPPDLALAARPAPVPAPLIRLLAALAPRLVAPVLDHARARGDTDDATPLDPGAPLGRLADRLTATLGLDHVEIVRTHERPYTVALEPAATGVRLALGGALIESAADPGLSFLLARSLVPLATGTLAARLLRQRDARAFFGALFGLLGADFALRTRDRKQADVFREALAPAIDGVEDPTALRALATAAAAPTRALGIAPLRAHLDAYDARLALALADGFGGAIETLRLLDFDDRPRDALEPAELDAFVADSDLARAMLAFAAHPACHALRRWRLTD